MTLISDFFFKVKVLKEENKIFNLESIALFLNIHKDDKSQWTSSKIHLHYGTLRRQWNIALNRS